MNLTEGFQVNLSDLLTEFEGSSGKASSFTLTGIRNISVRLLRLNSGQMMSPQRHGAFLLGKEKTICLKV